MSQATCPFCGTVNVGGLLQEVRPGQPTPMMTLCEHFVFEVFTHPVWDYLESELHTGLNRLPGVTQYEAALEALLRGALRFVEPMVFAAAPREETAARTAVIAFLRDRGYTVPDP